MTIFYLVMKNLIPKVKQKSKLCIFVLLKEMQ